MACLAPTGGIPTPVTPSAPQAVPWAWVAWSAIPGASDVAGIEGFEGSRGRPRVWVRQGDDGPARRAKVGREPDGTLRLRVPPLAQGACDLVVRLPGAGKATGADIVLPGALFIAAPTELALAPDPTATPTAARPGDILEITGRFLGPRRGRVQVASRRARILSWEQGVQVDAQGAAVDRIRLRVPRRLGDGVHPVIVTTAAGEGMLPDAVSIVDSGRGPEPVLRGEVGERHLESAAASVAWDVDATKGLVVIRGFDGSGARGHWLQLSLRYDPVAQGAVQLRGDDAIVQLVRIDPGDGQAWSSAYGWGGHARVDILSNQDDVIRGVASGWLVPVYGKAEALSVSASFTASRK